MGALGDTHVLRNAPLWESGLPSPLVQETSPDGKEPEQQPAENRAQLRKESTRQLAFLRVPTTR